jgi:hypothetical protein
LDLTFDELVKIEGGQAPKKPLTGGEKYAKNALVMLCEKNH